MFEWLHPALVYLLGALLLPLVPNGKARAFLMLLVPIIGLIPLLALPYGGDAPIQPFWRDPDNVFA